MTELEQLIAKFDRDYPDDMRLAREALKTDPLKASDLLVCIDITDALLCHEINRLRAELAECKQDAERYRWLRHPRMGWDIVHKTEVGLVCAEYLACVELDAAIDAARKGEGEQ